MCQIDRHFPFKNCDGAEQGNAHLESQYWGGGGKRIASPRPAWSIDLVPFGLDRETVLKQN